MLIELIRNLMNKFGTTIKEADSIIRKSVKPVFFVECASKKEYNAILTFITEEAYYVNVRVLYEDMDGEEYNEAKIDKDKDK